MRRRKEEEKIASNYVIELNEPAAAYAQMRKTSDSRTGIKEEAKVGYAR